MTLEQAKSARPGAPVIFRWSPMHPVKKAQFLGPAGYGEAVFIMLGDERWTVRACEVEHESVYLREQEEARNKRLKAKAHSKRVKWWRGRQRIIKHYLSGGKWNTFPEGIPAPAFINVIAAAKKRRVLVDSEDKIV